MYNVRRTLYVQCRIYTVGRIEGPLKFTCKTAYTVRRTLYGVKCTAYTYSVLHTVYVHTVYVHRTVYAVLHVNSSCARIWLIHRNENCFLVGPRIQIYSK